MKSLKGSSRLVKGRSGPLLSEHCFENLPRNSEQHEQGPSTIMKYQETDESNSTQTQWTNEKHRLYLKSMEASFVDQLYDSLDTLGFCSRQEEYSPDPKSSEQMHNGIATPSGQFKVFKDGSWARVNFSNCKRENPRPKREAKPDSVLANPWIQHYRSSGSHQTRITPSLQGQARLSPTVDSSDLRLGCQDSVGSTAEVTDQNFVDEVPEAGKQNRIRKQKCRKISAASGSGSDQVVPFAKLYLIDDAVKVQGFSKE